MMFCQSMRDSSRFRMEATHLKGHLQSHLRANVSNDAYVIAHIPPVQSFVDNHVSHRCKGYEAATRSQWKDWKERRLESPVGF